MVNHHIGKGAYENGGGGGERMKAVHRVTQTAHKLTSYLNRFNFGSVQVTPKINVHQVYQCCSWSGLLACMSRPLIHKLCVRVSLSLYEMVFSVHNKQLSRFFVATGLWIQSGWTGFHWRRESRHNDQRRVTNTARRQLSSCSPSRQEQIR